MRRPTSGAATGSETVKAAPPAGSDSASMLPPCSRTMDMQILRPRPVPPPGRLVVKKGSKSLGRASGLMPTPSSCTVTETRLPDVREANLNAAGLADFANGLFGVADEIEEDLNELVGVADDEREARDGLKFDFDVVAAEGMLVKLQRAIDDEVQVQRFFLRRGGAREFEKILHDARGAAGLAVGHIELAAWCSRRRPGDRGEVRWRREWR